jgi:hypothetical protein
MQDSILYRRIRELEQENRNQKVQIRNLEQEKRRLISRQKTLEKWLRKRLAPPHLEIVLQEAEEAFGRPESHGFSASNDSDLMKDSFLALESPKNKESGCLDFCGPLRRILPWVKSGTPVIVDGCIPGTVIKTGKTRFRIRLESSGQEEIHLIGGNRVHYGPKE